ncbi:hypothetical protein [Neobacillus mesonae]|uniref:hypothetical protein n=1 Tax=Neobacillus mesonae TaxID=1193713 RepID=UPI00203B79F2|nr:hypothetical protein [Neobacillus mesonae]MCM3570958.1 hypothetical protein [Neobacillus mesonae]
MDIKEQGLMKYYYEKLRDHNFDEKDCYAFLHLIQKHSKENGCIQELADFVMKRDQYNGSIKEKLFASRKKFEQLGKTKAAIRVDDVFSFREIKSELNKTLAGCQLEPLENEPINDFVTCLISLMQQVKMIQKDRETGKLFFAISQKQIILMIEIEVAQNFLKKTNVVFPVLTANNSYIALKKQDHYDTPYLFTDKIIEVVNHGGKLEVMVPDRTGL